MKKIFTLLMAFCAIFAAKAQIEVTTEDGTVIKTGETATVPVGFDVQDLSEYGLGILTTIQLPAQPYIKSSTAGTLKVTVECREQNKFQWCGLTGQCYDIETSMTLETAVAANASTALDLHPEFDYEAYGEMLAKVTVYWNGAEATSFNVKYVYADPSGIHTPLADAQAVGPTNGALAFCFTTAAPRTISLYTLDGRLLQQQRVTGQGQVALRPGLYLYRVTESGLVTAKGKALVK